jgi:hypothetical protein
MCELGLARPGKAGEGFGWKEGASFAPAPELPGALSGKPPAEKISILAARIGLGD